VKRGVRSLAKNIKPPSLPLVNRFHHLEIEEPHLPTADIDDPILASNHVSECYVSNVRVTPSSANSREHDLLRVEGKINGCYAVMLIDSGSTHDFISEEFVQRSGIETRTSPDALHVMLADGTSSSSRLETTGPLKVIVKDFSETQSFTVFPLSRYDAILGKPWLTRHNPSINFKTNEVRLSHEPFVADAKPPQPAKDQSPPIESFLISGRQARHALRSGAEGYLAWVTTEEADAPVIPPRKPPDLEHLLKEYSDVFPDELPCKLPPERPVDHEIRLEEGSAPPSRPAYRLSRPEMDELQTQLSEMLKRGFIEPSKSPYGAPVFFVKKSDGSLRMVCDWRQLNRITIKNKACLPNIDDLFDTVQGSSFFSKLDLRSGYNQIRIKEDDVEKTAINTPLGHFQFRVMGFGLTNAPATFQSLMNNVLQPYLRKFVVVFLDDILIFSKSWEEHLQHIRTVLDAMRSNQLFCKSSKCEFGASDVLFLGHRIDGRSLSPDPSKIRAVQDWPAPSSVKEVRQFLGFANYFRRFISHYSDISAPLEELTGKYSRFCWSDACQRSFEALRSALLCAPILCLADISKPFRVETDASDFAIAGILSQQADDSQWHPVAYTSRKLSSAERNYTATERETLAVVHALKVWRVYLFDEFEVITDNLAVSYLRTKPNLTKREARWVEFLADFHFMVRHRPGAHNIADSLSRRPDLIDLRPDDVEFTSEIQSLEYVTSIDPELVKAISAGYQMDKMFAPIIERMKASADDNLHERYSFDQNSGHLFLRDIDHNRLCIPVGPLRLKILQEHHDCLSAGHPGRDRTYSRLARRFYWPRMSIDTKAFVQSCDTCQRVKGGQSRTGLL